LPKETNTFICWSGDRSKYVAQLLREWLPGVVQAAKPWMSASDSEKGTRWLEVLTHALEDSSVGIVCLTPENLEAPWLLFEAGILSRAIHDRARLCTYLIGGLRPQDVKQPLGIFQHTMADREETREMAASINKAVSEEPLPDATLNKVFDAMWPDFEKRLKGLPAAPEGIKQGRGTDDMIAEILELVRASAPGIDQQRTIVNLQQMIAAVLRELDDLHERITRPRSAAAAEILGPGGAGPSARSTSPASELIPHAPFPPPTRAPFPEIPGGAAPSGTYSPPKK
jgi:hypothetical protein